MTPSSWLLPILIAAANPAATAPATDTPAPAKLEFPLAGYRVDAYDPVSKEGFILTMALPVPGKSSGFSVEIIRFPQMKTKPPLPVSFYPHSGYTVLSERRASPAELRVEFTRQHDQQTPKEHAYTLVTIANDISYDVTGVTLDTDWSAVADKLKTQVDSFAPSSTPAPGKVAFPHQGFRISRLDGPVPSGTKLKLLSMRDPEAWMTVSIEPYTKTLKDYRAERKPPQIMDSKHAFKIVAESSPAENALVTEYAEEEDKNHPEVQLLSFEKVVLAHGQLYRASALLTFAQFPEDPQKIAKIKAWVESLEVLPAPAPAPPAAPAK